jgi:hypothetical protein
MTAMASMSVVELRAAGRWPEVWAALMADGGVEAVYALAATMTDAELEADVRARQGQAAELKTRAVARARIGAQRAVLEHAAALLPHTA